MTAQCEAWRKARRTNTSGNIGDGRKTTIIVSSGRISMQNRQENSPIIFCSFLSIEWDTFFFTQIDSLCWFACKSTKVKWIFWYSSKYSLYFEIFWHETRNNSQNIRLPWYSLFAYLTFTPGTTRRIDVSVLCVHVENAQLRNFFSKQLCFCSTLVEDNSPTFSISVVKISARLSRSVYCFILRIRF